jgi:hypothetical protein
MDMRFYWIRDRVRQNQYHVYCRRGSTNRADYFTKHHPPKHHFAMRPAYFLEPNQDNYYSCLDNDIPPQAPSKANPTSGEGVLNAPALATQLTCGHSQRTDRPAYTHNLSSSLLSRTRYPLNACMLITISLQLQSQE